MKPDLCAWWGVCVALLMVLHCHARPSPDSDSESWRPLVSGHRVNRYTHGPNLTFGESARQPYVNSFQTQGLRIRECFKGLEYKSIVSLANRLSCIESATLSLFSMKGLYERRALHSTKLKLGKTNYVDKSRVYIEDDSKLGRNYDSLSLSHKAPLGDLQNLKVSNKRKDLNGYFESGSLKQRRKRQSAWRPEWAKTKSSAVKVQAPEDPEVKWVPVPLAPPKRDDDLDTKTNFITHNLVHDFVSNSLPDLSFPQEHAGTLVKIVGPILNKDPANSKWESVSLDDLILSHTPEPDHYHKPTTWHKKPSVILVQDTPDELLPKPPSYQNQHQDPIPEPHVPTPSPEPFPRPTYHFPRPSPEPPPKPKPTYHYPSPEPSSKPVYHYKPSTFNPPHHHSTPEPHYPYTSVIIQTSTPVYSDPEPEPSPEPPWNFHHPFPEPEPEDPYPEPEITFGDDTPVPEPSPEPSQHDAPNRPTPPPIYIVATQGSPLNPVTVSSGKPPPSILILASPEDSPSAPPPPQADPYPGGGGGPGGGGLVPIIPPIIPPIVPGAGGGVGGGGGGGGGGGSECAPIQLFNVQTITNSLENKDCIINLNSPVHNVNGDGQIEPPTVQADIPLNDIPDSSTVATTTKRPSGGSMTFLEQIGSFFASLTIFNPISLSFWSFLFAPMSILLASGLGVAALVLPWLFPSYWFGRRSSNINRRVDYYRPRYRFREPTLRFERSLRSGMELDDFLRNIGLL